MTTLNDVTALNEGRLDVSSLVGREIALYSDQYPGRPLTGKILSANDSQVVVGRSAGDHLIDSLLGNQKLYVQFHYKGQRVSVGSRVTKAGGGRCVLILDEQIVPLTRRRFERLPTEDTLRMAVFPRSPIKNIKLESLKWVETPSVNVSGGGTGITYTGHLEQGTLMLLNLNSEELEFPTLMVGRVRHSNPLDHGYYVGVEFIVNEEKEECMSRATVDRLPAAVFDYNKTKREKLNNRIVSLLKKFHRSDRQE